MGNRRGRLTVGDERRQIIASVKEAVGSGSRLGAACELMEISARTYQRWSRSDNVDDGRPGARHQPPNKLDEEERESILEVANSPEYADLPPSKIVPLLADSGRYIASESTFYRVLREKGQMTHRHRSKPPSGSKPRGLLAAGPNCVYSWDITYLPTRVRGMFFYLYMVMDVYSRKIVGWQVYKRESSELAADLMTDICITEGVKRDQVTLHSDNGGAMKGTTLLATLEKLGVIRSTSRPGVSSDNAYSESLFRTLKYVPYYPDRPFEDILEARRWVEGFVGWYNDVHLHSGIRFVTPSQRHGGLDREILSKRDEVYREAKRKNPLRWSGQTRNWSPVGEVWLNPDQRKDKAA